MKSPAAASAALSAATAAAAAAVLLTVSAAPGAPAAAAATPPQAAVTPSDAALPRPTAATIQQIAERLRPSLVRIHVVESDAEEGRETKGEAFGSGVIISPDGYVVTNHHVAGKARWISCTLSSKEEVPAKLIGTDPLADIAVIKLAPPPGGGTYQAAEWGDSSKLRVGDPILAMGSPLAFSQSVTAGIVSNTELILPAWQGSMTLEGEDVGSIVRWIGHDAQIYPGNSGGPLVDLNGQVVGINEISVGLAGAIPSVIARAVAEQLREKGHVSRAYLGVDLQPRLRQEDTAGTGVLVGGVLPGSPAAAAGVKPGDLITSVGGAALSARYPEQIPLVNLQIAGLPLGTAVPLTVLRGGKKLDLKVTPRERDPAAAEPVELKGWGVTASDITQTVARDDRFASTRGALVTSVQPGSPAAEAQPALDEDDVILSVGGKKIDSLKALTAVTDAIPAADGGTPTLVEIRRDGERLLTVVSVKRKPSEDTSTNLPRAWLPVNVQVVTRDLVKALGLPERTTGVRVTQIYTGTAAGDSTPLKVGDILTRIDDIPIEASQPEDADVFGQLIRQYKIGTQAKIALLRDGKPQSVSVTLTRGPKEERELPRFTDDDFGMILRSVSYKDRANKDAGPAEQGAIVVGVAKGSWAALAGLQQGDIIHTIAGDPVRDMEDARAKLAALKASRPKAVPLFVARGVHTLFVEVQTDYSLDRPAAHTAAGGASASAAPATSESAAGR